MDDSDYVLQSIKRMLNDVRDEWDIVFAESGAHAVAHLQERLFDIVVTDLKMPGMNGIEVLKTLRLLHPEASGFILSGNLESEEVRTCLAEGYRLIEKPCSAEMLKAIMEEDGA